MQLELICPNIDSNKFRKKNPNIEMLTPKAPGPTLQLPLHHGIFFRNTTNMVPLTASAAAFRSTNPCARCYSQCAKQGSKSDRNTGSRRQ